VQLAFVGAFVSTQLVFYTGRDFPLVDEPLANLDRALGIDWLAYARWIDSHPFLTTLGQAAYDSINAQPFVIVAALILTRQTERAYALIGMMAGALTVTSAAAVLLPALGPYTYFQIAVGDFSNMSLIPQTEWTVPIEWLRAAAFHTEIPPIKIGMISFPSYHAATAILFVWAAWRTPGFRWIALAINAAMLLATPVCGAHYFVDVLAGVAVAVIVIATLMGVPQFLPDAVCHAGASAGVRTTGCRYRELSALAGAKIAPGNTILMITSARARAQYDATVACHCVR
jgi:membrane-associated phospholipid phosphatase